MTPPMILPWHQQDWERITGGMDSLHHGLLVQGNRGTGVREFCFALAQYLLCERADSKSCGECRNCKLLLAGSHPDFHVISSEHEAVHGRIELLGAYCNRYQNAAERDKKAKPGVIISIDQIRTLIERFSTHAHIAANRVAVILPADTLNTNAANALLKLLEEPPPETIFILATAESFRLPKTILSRCFSMPLTNPQTQQSLTWLQQHMGEQEAQQSLKLAQGGPLLAHQLFEQGTMQELEKYSTGLAAVFEHKSSPLDLAAIASKIDFEQALERLQRYVCTIVNWHQGRTIDGNQPNRGRDQVSLNRLFDLYDRISHYRRIVRGTVNQQLAHEDLLLSLHRCSR